MDNKTYNKLLYIFLFTNSVISGIFGIFLPLFLFNISFTFSDISFFVAINSLMYFFVLFYIERIISKISIGNLISVTFFTYLLFISLIFFFQDYGFFIYALSIMSGIYFALFWTLYRFFFLKSVTHENIGKAFANIQAFVLVISQISILLGSYLLEKYGFDYVYFICLILIVLVIFLISIYGSSNFKFENYKVLKFKEIWKFNDKYNSRPIFILDGIFLFFESYYWLLIIFLFVDFSFLNSGIIIVLISILFAVVYGIMRQTIDRINISKLFRFMVYVYAFSWLLRGVFNHVEDYFYIQCVIIAVVGFISILFRLVYNKIFFQIAKNTIGTQYIFLKSYFSQIILVVSFLLFGIAFLVFDNSIFVFTWIFVISAIISLFYNLQRI